MNIPMSLAKLGDRRAIPLLIKIIEKLIKIENDDGDSADELFLSGETSRLVAELPSVYEFSFLHDYVSFI